VPFTLPQLEQQLARGELRPVYLIAGSEDLLRIEASDAVRRRACELGYGEREVFDIEPKFDWSVVEASMKTMSLFSPRRVIELRLPTGKPGTARGKGNKASEDLPNGAGDDGKSVTDGAKVIEAFCARPPADICLLITANEWSRKHETGWVRRVEAAGVFVPLWPMKPNEIPVWVARRLKSRGLTADAGAVALLAEFSEGNLLAAAQEIDKLVLSAEGKPIDAERMAALVADNARFTVFGLTDAAFAGDVARALRMLRGLRAEGESPVALLAWIAGQVQTLARLSQTRERGGNLSQAMSAAGIWESRQAVFRKSLGRLRSSDIDRALRQCALIERVNKGRAPGDAWIELDRLMLGLAKPQVLATM
jgi:DNA polymerase-3 subunit delta